MRSHGCAACALSTAASSGCRDTYTPVDGIRRHGRCEPEAAITFAQPQGLGLNFMRTLKHLVDKDKTDIRYHEIKKRE